MSRGVGDVFAGRFEIRERLGRGGNGEVFEVWDTRMKVVRALKVLVDHQQRDEAARKRFERESNLAAAIESDYVVRVIDFGFDADGTPWLLMERLHGENLEDYVRSKGPLSLDDARRLVVELGHALEAAHAKSIVHLDLKPSNLFLARAKRLGAPLELKVLDFGLARAIEAGQTNVQMTTQSVTFAWAPPEQYNAGEKLHETADVWPLGLIAFWILTGRSYWKTVTPDGGGSVLHVAGEVALGAVESASARAASFGGDGRLPEGFDAWFARCLKTKPGERWSDGAEATRALEELLTRATKAPSTPPPDPPPPPPPPPAVSVQETHVVAPPLPPAGLTVPVSGPLPPLTPKTPVPPPRDVPWRPLLAGGGLLAFFAIWKLWPEPRPNLAPPAAASPVVVFDAAVSIPLPPPPPPPPPPRVTEGCAHLAGGTFTMGDADYGPAHQVTLGAFCIDRTEVTVADYRACVNAHQCEAPNPYVNTNGDRSIFCNWGRSDRDDHPVNCLSATQAENFCVRRRHGHLPTEDQWEFAARGTEGRRYPWGNTPEPSPQNTNLCGSECSTFATGVGHTGWTAIANWRDPWPTTAAVGDLPRAGDTPDGLIGMAGNVWEWTRTPWGAYTATAGASTSYVNVDRNTRVNRGGGWGDIAPSLARAAFRNWLGATGRNAEVGFRCVAEEQ